MSALHTIDFANDNIAVSQAAYNHVSPINRFEFIMTWVGAALLIILTAISAWLIYAAQDSQAQIAGYAGVFLSGLTAAATAGERKLWHVKSILVLAALASAFAGIYIFSTSLNGNGLAGNQNAVWVISSLLALTISYAFKSRIALILSFIALIAGAYMYMSSDISFSAIALLIPLIAGLQVLIARQNQDEFMQLIAGTVTFAGLTLISYLCVQSGHITLTVLTSLILLMGGAFYNATAHPVKVWYENKTRSASLTAWTVLMTVTLISVWMWLYAIIKPPQTLPPLNNYLGHLGLIAGSGLLFASVFLKKPYASHKLSRRILSSFAIFSLSITHYFQPEIISYLKTNSMEALTYFAATSLVAIVATLTLSRFLSFVAYQHKQGIFISLMIAILICASVSILITMSESAIAIFAITMLLTAWALTLTQDNVNKTAFKATNVKTSHHDGLKDQNEKRHIAA